MPPAVMPPACVVLNTLQALLLPPVKLLMAVAPYLCLGGSPDNPGLANNPPPPPGRAVIPGAYLPDGAGAIC